MSDGRVCSADISEATRNKYKETLLQDIDAAFENTNATNSDGGNGARSRNRAVLGAAKAYEEMLGKIFRNDSSGDESNFKNAHKEWRNVALAHPSDEKKPTPKRFSKSKWIEPSIRKTTAMASKEILSAETKSKLYKIVKELVSTEETYVNILHLLDQVFHKRILEASVRKDILPESEVNCMFRHLPAIYMFHSSFLLPQLQERLQEWDVNPKIGDIMAQAGPFLKMYAFYAKNLDTAKAKIAAWKEKSKEFLSIIERIQRSPECQSLSLEHHMLAPIQRTPRYKMLLEDYVKRLPANTKLREEVQVALDLVMIAANHSNDFMKTSEKWQELIHVYSQLANVNFDTEDHSRVLLKEGKINKVAARSGRLQERYLYLFNDMILCCKPTIRAIHKVQGKNYVVSSNVGLLGMNTVNEENSAAPNVFCIHGVQKSIEFSCRTKKEKDEWLKAVNAAIEERIENANSFRRIRRNSTVSMSSFNGEAPMEEVDDGGDSNLLKVPTFKHSRPIILKEEELGTRAPYWIKDQDVTMCMLCSATFHSILKRRHHCRACGRVVCSACSDRKITLSFSDEKLKKVCEKCYLTLKYKKNLTSPDDGCTIMVEGPSVTEQHVLSGFFNFATDDQRRWMSTWCSIPSEESNTMECFKAKQDIKPFLVIDLNGSELSNIEKTEHGFSFKLKDGFGGEFYFASENLETADTWIKAITAKSSNRDKQPGNTAWV